MATRMREEGLQSDSPEVGSSAIKIAGAATSSSAILTRRRSPAYDVSACWIDYERARMTLTSTDPPLFV